MERGRSPRGGWGGRLGARGGVAVEEARGGVGMATYGRRQSGRLSGGQRQRVFLARALAQRAPLLVMDEPFAGIDARTEAALLELLREARAEGHSIIAVHHDLATVRAAFDWALVLNVRAVAAGPVEEVLVPQTLRRAYGVAVGAQGEAEELTWAT